MMEEDKTQAWLSDRFTQYVGVSQKQNVHTHNSTQEWPKKMQVKGNPPKGRANIC